MPYESTIYSQMTEDMVDAFKQAFLEKTREAVECFRPDLILCHHLYLLTAVVREAFPQYKTAAICHGTGLRQIKKNSLEREYILAHIKELHKVFCLHREQREEISRIYGVPAATPVKITYSSIYQANNIEQILKDLGDMYNSMVSGQHRLTFKLGMRAIGNRR